MPVTRPARDEVHVFPSASDFRAWLDANHASVAAQFIGFYKKGSGRVAMSYDQAVEEALCYGWIDGITYGIDDELVAVRFTPRRPTSSWSAINIARIEELTAAGRMHPAGTRAFETRDRSKDASYSYERPELELEAPMLARLRADRDAWAHWQGETRSFRRQAAYWVMSVKRPETSERRFTELLESANGGRRPKAFVVARINRVGSGPGKETDR